RGEPGAVSEYARVRVERRVAVADEDRAARRRHLHRVAEVEVAVLRPRRLRPEPAADVAADARPEPGSRRGIDAADVARRRPEREEGARARAAGGGEG